MILNSIALELANFLRGEVLIPGGIMSSERQLALDILEKWDTNDLKTPFSINPSRQKIRLKKLIENPILLNQGPFGTCVTEAFLFIIAKDFPYKFVNYAINMIESGSAHIGNLYIKTGQKFRKANFEGALTETQYASGMHECDILLIGAIRDSRNSFYDFDLTEDNWLMKKVNSKSYTESDDDFKYWFEETRLYKPVVYIENKNLNIIDAINKSGKKNETITLRIYSASDPAKPLQISKEMTSHRCVLYINSINEISPDQFVISIVTWGLSVVQVLTKKELQDCIFGYFEVNRKV